MNKIKTVRDLVVWQKSMDLVEEIYKITKELPKDEQYGLIPQMRRAAVSIPSNVAEGFRRQHSKEYKQFLCIALGSSSELETQVLIAKELEYITEEKNLLEILDHACAMMVNLEKKL